MSEYDAQHPHPMHVVRDGPRQAPPLLLIHGSGASGGSWSPVVAALADHHHVIRVDLPGCGQSPPGPSFAVPAQAGRVAALLDDLGLTCARRVDIPDDMVAEMRGTTYRALREVLRRNGEYVAERNVPERLATLGLPVLVIFGAADPRWDPSSAHQYEAVSGARVEFLPGVGHLPMIEATGATTELLLGFTVAAASTQPSRTGP